MIPPFLEQPLFNEKLDPFLYKGDFQQWVGFQLWLHLWRWCDNAHCSAIYIF